jgi:hypothetical protein
MTDILPGAVTTADLYRELVGMRTEVVRALERLAVIESRNQDDNQRSGDHEARLRMLERFRWKLAGACLTGGAVAGSLTTWAGYVVSHGR